MTATTTTATTTTAATTTTRIPAKFMVRRRHRGQPPQDATAVTATSTSGHRRQEQQQHNVTAAAAAAPTASAFPLLTSTVSLSFWGGLDPLTGIVIDTTHPLAGQCVKDTILCLPSGRGSCTASQVLLELILNRQAPKALVMRDVDGLAAMGAVIAQEVFGIGNTTTAAEHDDGAMDIVTVGEAGFARLLLESKASSHGAVCPWTGQVILGPNAAEVEQELLRIQSNTSQLHSYDDEEVQYTEEELKLLAACQNNQAKRMALRVLFRFAHFTSDHPTYQTVTKAHIDGCTYIGPGGLHFVQRLVQAGGKVVIPTTLNSVSTDRQRWQALGVPVSYAQNAIALGDAYLALGCQPSFTCAPYLLPPSQNDNNNASNSRIPTLGEHIVWGESNAVVYANTVLGARTEKYADYLDICCALTGLVPAAGVHLDPNRIPTIVLDATNLIRELLLLSKGNHDDADVQELLNLDVLFPVLGHLCGTLSDGKLPLLIGLQELATAVPPPQDNRMTVTKDHLKAFCAAYGTTGSTPLIHIAGITPEALDETLVQEWIQHARRNQAIRLVTMEQLQTTFETLDGQQQQQQAANRDSNSHDKDESKEETSKVDLIALGNPHFSVTECHNLARMISYWSRSAAAAEPPKKHPDVRMMICMSRELYGMAQQEKLTLYDNKNDATTATKGLIEVLEEFGVEFVNDTCWCMLLDPPVIPVKSNARILTNSGKYAHYGPGLTHRPFRFGSTADCVQAAFTGHYYSNLQPNSQMTKAATAGAATDRPHSLPQWLTLRGPWAAAAAATDGQRRTFATYAARSLVKSFLRRRPWK